MVVALLEKVVESSRISVKQRSNGKTEISDAIEAHHGDYEPLEAPDAEDTAYHQKNRVKRYDKEPVFIPEPLESEASPASYVESKKQGKIASQKTVVNEFRDEGAPKKSLTPEEGSKYMIRILAEAVFRLGDRLDPTTKELMLFWLQTPEGKTVRDIAQALSPYGRNYGFTYAS